MAFHETLAFLLVSFIYFIISDCILPLALLNGPQGGVVLDVSRGSWCLLKKKKKIDSPISFELIRNVVGVL